MRRPGCCILPLRELEPLAGSRTSRLLALHRARVAGQQPGRAQLRAVHLIRLAERPRDRVAHGPCLAADTSNIDMRHDIERAQGISGRERLLDVLDQRRPGEIIAKRTAIDIPLAGPRREVDTRDAGLAPPNGLPTELRDSRHQFSFDFVMIANGLGSWASCGCSAPAYTFSLVRSF